MPRNTATPLPSRREKKEKKNENFFLFLSCHYPPPPKEATIRRPKTCFGLPTLDLLKFGTQTHLGLAPAQVWRDLRNKKRFSKLMHSAHAPSLSAIYATDIIRSGCPSFELYKAVLYLSNSGLYFPSSLQFSCLRYRHFPSPFLFSRK